MDFKKITDEITDYIQSLVDCGFEVGVFRRFESDINGYKTSQIKNIVFLLDSIEYIPTSDIQEELEEAMDRIEEFYKIDEVKINNNYIKGYPGNPKYSFPRIPDKVKRIEISVREKENPKFQKIKNFLDFK